jgi:DNA-binding CsgD family transcriptional regulator/tetratricopeptide (TPR) repeat protein
MAGAAGRLLGRTAELRVLDELIAQSVRRGHALVIEGEPGIGKTRLLQTARERASSAGLQVYSAAAEELDSRRPFGVIADCLGIRPTATDARRREIGKHLLSEATPEAAEWPAPDPGPEYRLVEQVVALVDHLSAGGPVVLSLDDLQWADQSSLVVVHHLSRQLDRLPLLLLLAARPVPRPARLASLMGQLPIDATTTLQLGPLDAATCADLLEALLGLEPGPSLLRHVESAGGNPLYVEVLANALISDGTLQVTPDRRAETPATRLPAGLPDAILRRLSFLTPETLRLLELASVLGGSFSVTDLSLMSGRLVAALVDPLAEGMRAGVLEEQGDRLVFRHQLIREGLYLGLPAAVRKGLHRDVWHTLAASGAPAVQVAEHVTRGASVGDREAVGWLQRAAREVGPRAPGTAVDLLQRALELTDAADTDRGQILPDLAVALIWAGRLHDGESVSRQALARPDGVVGESGVRLCLAQALVLLDRASDARRQAEAAAAVVAASPSARVRASAWASLARLSEGNVSGAIEYANRARVEAERLGDAPARCQALATLSLAADLQAQFQEAADLATLAVDEAVRDATREGHRALAHLVLGRALADMDRLEEASDSVQRGRQICEQLGARGALPSHHFTASMCCFALGRWDDALAEAETGLDLAEELGVGWRAPACATGALIALHRDDFWQAEHWLQRAEVRPATPGARYQFDRLTWVRALLLESAGRLGEALDELRGAWDTCERLGLSAELPVLGPDLVRLARRVDQPAGRELAARAARSLGVVADRNPFVPWVAGAALAARAAAEDDVHMLIRAADVYRDGPRPLERAQCCEDAGAALVLRGEVERGRTLLVEAYGLYEQLQASRDIRRVRASLRSAGVRSGPVGRRQRPKRGWQALTETELVVVRLVAERLSNPEIAERLFLSRRTVQTHVSHALAKVNLATRVELAAEAQRHGWRLRLEHEPER